MEIGTHVFPKSKQTGQLYIYIYITACTVVQAVVKATSQSNVKGQILTPLALRNP